MRPISLDAISKLLPAPNANEMIDEAFELRWLVSEGQLKPYITIQITEQMVRATFPTDQNNGRGRVWLQRTQRPISSDDLHRFLVICVGIAELGKLKIWASNPTQEILHQKALKAFMALPCVDLEPRYSNATLRALKAFESDADQAGMRVEDYLQLVVYNPIGNPTGR